MLAEQLFGIIDAIVVDILTERQILATLDAVGNISGVGSQLASDIRWF